MRKIRAGAYSLIILLSAVAYRLDAQCPQFPTSSIVGNAQPVCEGATFTMSVSGLDIPPGSSVDWYLGSTPVFNPYSGQGMFLGSVPAMVNPCNDLPEILYIMVNPDNIQAGGTGDQCDEFIVLWTGSGGFSTTDILVSNLGPGTFVWDDFVAGNGATFTCGTPLPPGPVPANAILIIQSNTTNNIPIDSDVLCASGLPVYIIAYAGSSSCTGGYFDNTAGPCSSCPVMIDITGNPCQYDLELDYQPPASAPNGWAWANTGSGVFADIIPPLTIPSPGGGNVMIDDFMWTVPANFCETSGGGPYWITGILDPPPAAGCQEIFTNYFGSEIICPQLILSGGGDVCEGNCPDAPTEISFAILGGDTPYEVDIQVTASSFPPFNIPDLPVSDGQTIQICLEGFLPSFDPGTGTLTIPTLAIGLSATVTVISATSATGCMVDVDPDFLTLNFIETPTVNTGPDQSICAGESVNISGSVGGSATMGSWSTNGDGDFEDPDDLTTLYTPGPGDIASGSVTLTLTATDDNSICIPVSSSINVTIEPALLIEVNTPLTICDNDEAIIEAFVSGSSEPCQWVTNGDGSFDDPFSATTLYTPGSQDIGNGMVTLMYTPIDPDACVMGNEPLILTIVPAPDVTVPQNLEVCAGDSIVVAILIQGSFSNVTWSSSGDGMLVLESQTVITYTPGPLDLQDQFFVLSVSVQSSFPECGLTTYNMPVNVLDCDCPPFTLDMPADPLCSVSESIDLDDLVIAGGAGSWSISGSPSGGNPATITGSVFSTFESDPGVYSVTYTLTSPQPGCPASESIDILVVSPSIPSAGPDQAYCGPQAVMLNGFVTPANGYPVQWTSSGDGVFQNQNAAITSYTPGPQDSISPVLSFVLQVMDPVCGMQQDTVILYFHAPPEIQLATDTVDVCNTIEFGAVVNFTSLITGGDAGGIWSDLSGIGVDFSNPDSVSFEGITEGFYVFGYTTNSAVSPCSETMDSMIVEVKECLCPLLQVQNVPGGLCNNLASIDMNAFIMAGAPGTWQVIAPPPGSNPATFTGSVFEILDRDQGNYKVRFTFDAAPIPGCPDSAEVDVFIQSQLTLSVPDDTATCGQMPVEIVASIGGSTVGVTWATTGSGSFSDPGSQVTLYNPSIFDVASAQVLLVAMTMDTFGFCPSVSDTIQLFIPTPPSTSFSALGDTLCNHPDSNSTINLSGLITSGDGTGFWMDADGAMVNLTDPSQVDFAGVLPGTYRLVYTTQTAVPPCMDSVYTITLLIEDCACPALQLSPDDLIVCPSDSADLNSLILQAEAGTWSITDGPSGIWPVINGNQLLTGNALSGSYTLTYTLTNSKPGCPASADVIMLLEAPLGVSVSDIACDATQTTYEVVLTSNATSVTSDFGTVNSPGVGDFIITNVPAGQNILLTLSSASGLCMRTYGITAPDCDCTLFTEDIADTITFCPGDTIVLIPFITGAQGLPFSTWVTPEGVKMRPTLPLSMPGQYIWIVRDSLGCEERDTFYAAFMGPVSMDVLTVAPSCEGMEDGTILITDVAGGSPPFSVTLDQGSPLLITQFPFEFAQLGSGDYTVTLMDMVGCTIDTMVTVASVSMQAINLGPDLTMAKGDSVWIVPVLNGIEPLSFIWSPPVPGQDLEPFWFAPEMTTLLSLTVFDSAGCKYMDEMWVTVFEKSKIFVPNVFSPNGDQINDVLHVFTNLPDAFLVSLEIFDRWGGLLFAQYDGGPLSWDGTVGAQPVSSGVYVYKLTWKDEEGQTHIQTGDVTVLY